MLRAWPLLCLLTCFVGCMASGKPVGPKPPIDFADFFNGNWTVETRSLTASKGAGGGVTIGHYEMRREGELGLRGLYYEDGAALPDEVGGGTERKRELWIRVDLETPSSGVFYTAKVQDDEDEWAADYKKLFDLDFEVHANGARVSRGTWHGKKQGLYTLTVTRQLNFELVIYTGGGDEKGPTVQYMSARKPAPPKSMLYQYGPTALIMAVFLGSKLLKSGFGRILAKREAAIERREAAAQGKGQ